MPVFVPLRESRFLYKVPLSSFSPQRPCKFICKPATLTDCTTFLSTQSGIAFDLEFDSHRIAYGTTLCLIQIATPDACYIIDPMAGLDLSSLYGVFSNPQIQKLVHSPGEDLRVLHGLGCVPQNLFDTDVAAKLLNYEQSSLAAMLFNKLGIILNKGQQRSNWMRRPLSPEQLEYAADDVLHLHSLKAALVAEAEEKGLLDIVCGEQAIWDTTSFAQDESKTFFLKGADLYTSPYDQHVLNALFCYRDELARSLNKPAFQVMDETIVRRLADRSMQPIELATAKGLYGPYKTAQFAQQVTVKLHAVLDEALRLKLSRTSPAKSIPTAAEREAKAQAARDRTTIFEPLQAALAKRFGQFAARYLLSKTKAEDILRRATTITDLKPAYKPQLMRSTAESLGIDISSYW